jgi:MFS family permease
LSKSGAGILSAAYAAGTLTAALPSGWLAAKIGFKKAMLVGLALLGVSSVVFAFAQSVVLLDIARFAEGVGGACAWTGGLAWLIAAAPVERRGELIGAALAAAIFGILLGPVIGGIASVVGPEIVFTSVGVIAAVLAVRVLTFEAPPPRPPPDLRSVARTIFTRPVLFAFWLVILPSMLSGLFDVLIPLRLDSLGASAVAVGAAFFGAAALESFTAPAIGRLSDRRGRMLPIRLGLIACPLAALALPLPDSVFVVAVALVVVVLAMSLIWTPAMALLSDNAEEAGLDLAFATAMVSLAWAGGQVIGGSAFTALADSTTDATSYALVAALFVATLAAVFATVPRRLPA